MEKVQEVQEYLTGWFRKVRVVRQCDGTECCSPEQIVFMIAGALEKVQEVQEYLTGWFRKVRVSMVVSLCLLHLAVGLCFLLVQGLLRICSRRRVATPLCQDVPSIVETQHGAADP